MPEDDLLAGVEFSSPRPGLILMNHAAEICEGEHCCLHNPSAHRMRDWPLEFRTDRPLLCPTHGDHALVLTERLCPVDGVGCPDPDSLAYLRVHDPDDLGAWGVHGCCGHGHEPLPSNGDANA